MEEPGFIVILTEGGEGKVDVVRAIRKIAGLSLWDSRRLIDAAPVKVMDPNWIEVADEVAGSLKEAGATVEVICTWCDRNADPEKRPLDPGPCEGPWPSGTCRASCSTQE